MTSATDGVSRTLSPPSQPLALSLSDRERSERLERALRDVGGGAALSALPAVPLGAPASSARSLAKMKRFLSTLVQFGSDISPDTGDRVRALVFSLVVSMVAVAHHWSPGHMVSHSECSRAGHTIPGPACSVSEQCAHARIRTPWAGLGPS